MSKNTNKKIATVALVATMVTQNIQPVLAVENLNTELPKAKDLIISEYMEGSGSNKAIEIYNGTGKSVDLSKYKLEVYTNGSTKAQNTHQLSGTLEHDKTYVIVDSSANDEIKEKGNITSAESKVTYYNGDDAVVLKNNEDVIDSIGKIGEDPGDAWISNNVSTKDMTLVRKSSIAQGDTNTSDDFDPSVEWEAYNKDYADNLGKHLMDAVHGGDTLAPSAQLINKVESHNISDDLQISVKAEDDRKVESVILYYRNVGEVEYKELLLSRFNDTYTATI